MNVRKNYENIKFQKLSTSTQSFSSKVEKFDENLPEVINQINQLSYKTFNDLPRGGFGDHYHDDHDDSVCDDVPSSSIRVDKVIAGPDQPPPVLNNDPPQDASCTNLFFHKLPFCFLNIIS